MRRLLIATFVLSLASPALADAIGPPTPIECAPGTSASTNHCGTVCMVDTCTSDTDCAAGQRCEARSLCIEEVPCGGWGGTYTIAHGECASAGACAEGACQSVQACVPAMSGADAGPNVEHVAWGCGCRATGGASGGAIAMALMIALGLVIRRRRG